MTGCSSYQSEYDAQEESLLSSTTNSIKSLFQSSKPVLLAGSSKQENAHSIHYYAEKLAEQFFLTSEKIDLNKTIVVGTFLPMSEISGNNLPQTNPIAHQLQESFVTIATQVGLKVVEFKAMSQIKIKNNQDIMLSRQVAELNPNINADYYLTGTYSGHKEQLVVNVRLIALPSNIVVAAATDYIPVDVMEYQSHIKLKNNQIYRGAN